MLIMLIVQIAQRMQISIRPFLYTGDPYFTFLQKNFGVLNISGFTMGLYGLATRLHVGLQTHKQTRKVRLAVQQGAPECERCIRM